MKHRIPLLLLSFAWIPLLTMLLALSDGSTSTTLGIAGMTSLAASTWLRLLDSWAPLPRPRPRITIRALCVPISRVASVSLLLVFVGLLGMALDFVVGGTVIQDMQGRFGWAIPALIIISPVGTVASAVMVIWRGRINLTPTGMQGRYFVKDHRVRWDDMQDVALDTDKEFDAVKISQVAGKRPFGIRGDDTVLSAAAWVDILTHYRDHPEDRAEIGTQASLDRLLNDSA